MGSHLNLVLALILSDGYFAVPARHCDHWGQCSRPGLGPGNTALASSDCFTVFGTGHSSTRGKLKIFF